MMSRIAGALVGCAIMMAAAPAQAAPIVFEGSGGTKAARVTFENVGGSLVVRLKNTSMSDVTVPSDLLTAVFFNVNGNPSLTRTSAVLGSGSTVVNDTQPAGGVVGGEWAYRKSLNVYGGANTGLSSTGLSLFGSGDRFPGANLDGPNSPDGMQYGITSAGDNPATANGGLAGTPLIDNEVVFTLGGWGLKEPTDYISNVTFHYGTSFGEGKLTGKRITVVTQVPEPAALLLFGVAGVALRFRSRRNRN